MDISVNEPNLHRGYAIEQLSLLTRPLCHANNVFEAALASPSGSALSSHIAEIRSNGLQARRVTKSINDGLSR